MSPDINFLARMLIKEDRCERRLGRVIRKDRWEKMGEEVVDGKHYSSLC